MTFHFTTNVTVIFKSESTSCLLLFCVLSFTKMSFSISLWFILFFCCFFRFITKILYLSVFYIQTMSLFLCSTLFHFFSDFSKEIFESDENGESRDGEVPLLPLEVVLQVSRPLRVEKVFVKFRHFFRRNRFLVHLVRVFLVHHL